MSLSHHLRRPSTPDSRKRLERLPRVSAPSLQLLLGVLLLTLSSGLLGACEGGSEQGGGGASGAGSGGSGGNGGDGGDGPVTCLPGTGLQGDIIAPNPALVTVEYPYFHDDTDDLDDLDDEPTYPDRLGEGSEIVELQGDRLYSLSRYAGLSVMDVADPERLRLLGGFKTRDEPFRLYLRGSVALALFTHERNPAQGNDHLLALNIEDPAAITLLGELKLPRGTVESHLVGDVLYVVHALGVTSYNISEPQSPRQVSQLNVGTAVPHVAGKRVYMAGDDFIQVIDISDPDGNMVAGARLTETGRLETDWQLDEHNGVLRVLGRHGTSSTPRLQTFVVASAQDVTRLANLQLDGTWPDGAAGVRFDGERGFVIAVDPNETLLTFDLSDPAAPQQRAALEMPAPTFRIEPHGNQLLVLGATSLTGGQLYASLIDVSDLTRPVQTSRVDFQGDWRGLRSEWDHVNSGSALVPEAGLIVVPKYGYDLGLGYYGCGFSQRGAQLIDWTGDSLVKRGVATSTGRFRRSLMHRGHLLAVGDDAVQTFDVSDRDKSRETGDLALARRVSRMAKAGDNLVRLGASWWTQTAELDVVRANGASSIEPLGKLSSVPGLTPAACSGGIGGSHLFTHGNMTYVVGNPNPTLPWPLSGTRVTAVDVSDAQIPRLVGPTLGSTVFKTRRNADAVIGGGQTVPSGGWLAQLGSSLAILDLEVDWVDGFYVTRDPQVLIIDLADPTNPKTSSINLPAGQFFTGLLASGTSIYTSHFEPLADDPSRGRFFVDRIDLTEPSAPVLTQVNVPGSLLGVDAASGKAVLVDYALHSEHLEARKDCTGHSHYQTDDASEPDYGGYTDGPGTCTYATHGLLLVSLEASGANVHTRCALNGRERPAALAMGDAVFFTQSNKRELHVVSGFAEGSLQVEALELPPELAAYAGHLTASGKQAALIGADNTLAVVDARDPLAPLLSSSEQLSSYPEDLMLDSSQVYVSMFEDGAISRPLH